MRGHPGPGFDAVADETAHKQRWTLEDRAELKMQLRRLSNISPYLIVLALPGSFVMLPVLAWWLDRRRNRQPPSQLGAPR